MDPCLFSLSSPNGVLHGLIGVHVDDGLCCGDSVFSEALSKLETTFPLVPSVRAISYLLEYELDRIPRAIYTWIRLNTSRE